MNKQAIQPRGKNEGVSNVVLGVDTKGKIKTEDYPVASLYNTQRLILAKMPLAIPQLYVFMTLPTHL